MAILNVTLEMAVAGCDDGEHGNQKIMVKAEVR
jgi:hypothetical protein